MLKKIDENNINHHVVLLVTNNEDTVSTIKKLNQADSLMMLAGTQLIKDKGKLKFKNILYTPPTIFLDVLLAQKPELKRVAQAYQLYKKDQKNEVHQNGEVTHTVMNAVLSVSLVVNRLKNILKENKEKYDFSELIKDEEIDINSILLTEGYKHPYLASALVSPSSSTNIVSSGIAINKISHFDSIQSGYDMEFYLWFHSVIPKEKEQQDILGCENKNSNCFDNIEFLNTKTPIALYDALKSTEVRAKKEKQDPPNINQMSAKLDLYSKQENAKGEYEYFRRYHITGRFYTQNRKNYALGQYEMFIRFRHYNNDYSKIIYMPDNHDGIFTLEDKKNTVLNKAKSHVVDNSSFTLEQNILYTRLSQKAMLGRPKGTNQSNHFSHLVAEYKVKPVLWSFRGLISWVNQKISSQEKSINLGLMVLFLMVSVGMFIFIKSGQHKELFYIASSYWWFLQVCISLFILLLIELSITQALLDYKVLLGEIHNTLMAYTRNIIAVLWWLVPAYYITSAFQQFLWDPIEKDTGAKVPNVLRLFVITVIYTVATLGILAFVFKLEPQGLAATSGAIAILFAFASKIDFSNIIAGLGISLSKIFKLGDWVLINNDIEGKVVEMTHRSTKIITFDSAIINIPNTTVSNAVIKNYTRPDSSFRLIIHLETAPDYRFEEVERVLLDAVASTEGVLTTPEPFVVFKGQGDSCQIYEVAFFIDDYEKRYGLWQATWRRIWRHLETAGIDLATPQRQVFLPKTEKDTTSHILKAINRCSAFVNLSDEGKEKIAQLSQVYHYRKGDTVLEAQEANNHIIMITSGVLSFYYHDGKEGKSLGVAEAFGLNNEVANMKVMAKTEAEVIKIKHHDFVSIT